LGGSKGCGETFQDLCVHRSRRRGEGSRRQGEVLYLILPTYLIDAKEHSVVRIDNI